MHYLINPQVTHNFMGCPSNVLLDFLDSRSPLLLVAMSPYPGPVPRLFWAVTVLKSLSHLLRGMSLSLDWVLRS